MDNCKEKIDLGQYWHLKDNNYYCFKWGSCRPSEGSPGPHATFFILIKIIELIVYISSIESGSLPYQFIDPRPVSYLEH